MGIVIVKPFASKKRVRVEIVGESLAKQSMRDECDINQIMAKYQKTGAVSHLNKHGADYGFASGEDFSESMRVITAAQGMFDDLPSSVRTRFGNDPALFLDFVQDEENVDEMVKLGLAEEVVLETAPKETAEEVVVEEGSPSDKASDED